MGENLISKKIKFWSKVNFIASLINVVLAFGGLFTCIIVEFNDFNYFVYFVLCAVCFGVIGVAIVCIVFMIISWYKLRKLKKYKMQTEQNDEIETIKETFLPDNTAEDCDAENNLSDTEDNNE